MLGQHRVPGVLRPGEVLFPWLNPVHYFTFYFPIKRGRRYFSEYIYSIHPHDHFIIMFEGDTAVRIDKPNTGNPLSNS